MKECGRKKESDLDKTAKQQLEKSTEISRKQEPELHSKVRDLEVTVETLEYHITKLEEEGKKKK